MPTIQFVTNGNDYVSDIDQIGHSTFMDEVATVADITPFKFALRESFGAVNPDPSYRYGVSLRIEDGSASILIYKTNLAPEASPGVPVPDMSEQELARNLQQQNDDRRALEALVADAQAAGVIDDAGVIK